MLKTSLQTDTLTHMMLPVAAIIALQIASQLLLMIIVMFIILTFFTVLNSQKDGPRDKFGFEEQ